MKLSRNRFAALLMTIAVLITCAAAPGNAGESAPADTTLPIVDSPLTLTYFMPLNPKVTKTVSNYNEIYYYQELERLTGIHIEFVHPPMGQDTEQFNLMVSSQAFTDIIWRGWTGYPGGLTKAIADGVMIDLSDAIAKWAPGITAQYERNPRIRIDTSTDAGEICFFPIIYDEMLQKQQSGFFIRYDWLEKGGFALPETIEDWYEVLTYFKTQDPNGNGLADELPYVCTGFGQLYPFAYAWHINNGFIVEDGKPVYSPADPRYREFVETMAKWYAEGLIDPEYLTTQQIDVDNRMATGVGGASFERNSKTSALTTIFKSTDPNAKIKGAKYPVIEKGMPTINTDHFLVLINNGGACVTSSNQHVEETVKWLDYSYTEAGYFLANWGVEGWPLMEIRDDGLPYLTDYVMKNPDGLSMDEAIARYTPGSLDSPRRYDPRLYDQRMMVFPEQYETAALWDQADNSGRMPNVSFALAESMEISSILAELDTYRAETINGMIMGKIPLSEYDQYLAQLERLGVPRLVELYTNALANYYNRK